MRVNRSLALTAALALSASAGAALINRTPGFPAITFDTTGTLAYNSTSDLLSVNAQSVAARFSPSLPPRLVTGSPKDITINVVVNYRGNLVGGVAGDDLVVQGEIDENGDTIIDYSGILLTGEIIQFGYADSGTATDQFDFLFELTGGALAPQYAGRDILVKLTSEQSTFTGKFWYNFGGKAKGTMGPVCPDREAPTVVCDAVAVNPDGGSDDGDGSSDDDSADGGGLRQLVIEASDDCEIRSLVAVIDIGCTKVFVANGDLINVHCNSGGDDDSSDDGGSSICSAVEGPDGVLEINADSAVLVVTVTDEAGKTTTCTTPLCVRSSDDESS
jgi:hypothetical protein